MKSAGSALPGSGPLWSTGAVIASFCDGPGSWITGAVIASFRRAVLLPLM